MAGLFSPPGYCPRLSTQITGTYYNIERTFIAASFNLERTKVEEKLTRRRIREVY